MNYTETGFRAVYRRFCVFEAEGPMEKMLTDGTLPGVGKGDCVLCYGYMDDERGLCLEVLAAGVRKDGSVGFFDAPQGAPRIVLGIESVKEIGFEFLEDPHGRLMQKFGRQLASLEEFAPSEEVEATRQMTFLDGLRDAVHIDDIDVWLSKEGLDPEKLKVRLTGTGNRFLMGTLREEPRQDFGYHAGESIAFFAQQQEDGSVECVSDMNPDRALTAADLEDGTILQEAIRQFNEERTEEGAVEILQLLRDSMVWIPCKVQLEPLRLDPDILRNGDALFMPVFSSEETMGEYGDQFSKVQKPMLEAMDMAEKSENRLYGIVVDAFTDHYVLGLELFDVVREIKSRLA